MEFIFASENTVPTVYAPVFLTTVKRRCPLEYWSTAARPLVTQDFYCRRNPTEKDQVQIALSV